MPDLPSRGFVLLSPPPGGCADARRRGRIRKLRRAYAVSSTVAVVTLGLAVGVTSLSTSAADRLEPAPFGRDLMPPSAAASPAPTPAPPPAPEAGREQLAGTASVPAPLRTPAATPLDRREVPGGQPARAPGRGEAGQVEPGPAGISRSYRPPERGAVNLCASSAGVGETGPPRTSAGQWCQFLLSEPVPGGHRLELRVCRSTNAEQAVLHVDPARPLVLRVAQGESERWRLPPIAASGVREALPTESGGCWVWAYRWDGTGTSGEQLPPGRYTAYGSSLAEELRGSPEERQEIEVQ